jgi:hypothetical protein
MNGSVSPAADLAEASSADYQVAVEGFKFDVRTTATEELNIPQKKKGLPRGRPFSEFGARSWTRTNDPLINSLLLQIS